MMKILTPVLSIALGFGASLAALTPSSASAALAGTVACTKCATGKYGHYCASTTVKKRCYVIKFDGTSSCFMNSASNCKYGGVNIIRWG